MHAFLNRNFSGHEQITGCFLSGDKEGKGEDREKAQKIVVSRDDWVANWKMFQVQMKS